MNSETKNNVFKDKDERSFDTFSKKIKNARLNYFVGKSKKKKGLTLVVAAKKIGISTTYLWELENEEKIKPNTLITHYLERFYHFKAGELSKLLSDECKLNKKSNMG